VREHLFEGASLGHTAVLFGGRDDSKVLGDTWEWDGATWTQQPVAGPSARVQQAMAPLNGKVVLFGGGGALVGSYLNDTWEWDGGAWTQRTVLGPPARALSAMAPLNGALFLFGGDNGHGEDADAWTWDGTAWTPVTANGPSARAAYAMTTLP
jgi:hypothetical protein